jgi:hypothetical protein
MDTSKDPMDHVFSHHQDALLDMWVMEMEIVSQYQWQQYAQKDMRVTEMVIVFWFLQLKDQLQHQLILLKHK